MISEGYRVVRYRRPSASVRRKRRQQYRKRRAKLKRYAKRYRNRSSTKRRMKRLKSVRKRMHLRPGRRLRLAGVGSEGNIMEISESLQSVMAGLSSGMKDMFLSYIEAALWSSNDNADDSGGEPLDANYDYTDIDEKTLKVMLKDCQKFYAEMPEADEWSFEQLGHDFWLTRNRHGAGFWDRGHGEIGEKLTDLAHKFGEFDLYVGDDGKIYGEGSSMHEQESNMNKELEIKESGEVKLHSTLQSDVYYTNFKNLPKEAQEKLKSAEVEIENSKYTVYEDSAFIRAEVEVNGALWKAEISLGSVDIKNSDYNYDDEKQEYVDNEGRVVDSYEYAEMVADELMATSDLDYTDVYLTHIKDLEESKVTKEIQQIQESINEFKTFIDEKSQNHLADAFRSSVRVSTKLIEAYEKIEKPVVVESVEIVNEFDIKLPDFIYDHRTEVLSESFEDVLGVKKVVVEDKAPNKKDNTIDQVIVDLKQIKEHSEKLVVHASKGLLDEVEAKDFLKKARQYMSDAMNMISITEDKDIVENTEVVSQKEFEGGFSVNMIVDGKHIHAEMKPSGWVWALLSHDDKMPTYGKSWEEETLAPREVRKDIESFKDFVEGMAKKLIKRGKADKSNFTNRGEDVQSGQVFKKENKFMVKNQKTGGYYEIHDQNKARDLDGAMIDFEVDHDGKAKITEDKKKTKKIHYYDIKWETDGEKVNLPNEEFVIMDKDYDPETDGADLLSDKYGYLVQGFFCKEVRDEIGEAKLKELNPSDEKNHKEMNRRVKMIQDKLNLKNPSKDEIKMLTRTAELDHSSEKAMIDHAKVILQNAGVTIVESVVDEAKLDSEAIIGAIDAIKKVVDEDKGLNDDQKELVSNQLEIIHEMVKSHEEQEVKTSILNAKVINFCAEQIEAIVKESSKDLIGKVDEELDKIVAAVAAHEALMKDADVKEEPKDSSEEKPEEKPKEKPEETKEESKVKIDVNKEEVVL